MWVESVDADSVVGGVGLVVWCGFEGGVVGVFWGVAVEGSVGSLGVVGVLEVV